VSLALPPAGVPAADAAAARPAAAGPVTNCPAAPSGVNFEAPSLRGASKTVALTFDDGPGASTAQILSILEAYGVRATFFNIGQQEASWPDDVKAEAADGFLVANHTWSHPDLVTLSASDQAAQMDMVTKEQESLVGTAPCELRPPYGDYDSTTLQLAQARHLSVWLWDVDTEDWEADGSGSAYWVNRIVSLAESEGGALSHPVVLMHNQGIPMPATVAALPIVIQFFKAHGYRFVDLLGRGGPPAGCGPSAPPAPAPGTAVAAGTTLPSGSHVDSPGGQYSLVMQAGGNLVLYTDTHRAVWASRTNGFPGAFARMQGDGNFVIYSGRRVIWATGTGGHPGAELWVETDARLVIARGRTRWWTSRSQNFLLASGEQLRSGWYLTSPGTACHLLMRRDGDLVLYSASGQTVWASGTRRHPGAYAEMETSGEVVIYTSSGARLWATHTGGNAGARLFVSSDASVFIETGTGKMPWLAG
jgi:peptidoglycan/xylan/chitin deacetylase (PgdA/CDA1 family)